MSKIRTREKAISLRQKGFTYSQIKNDLDVSKSTLSGWLKNFPLNQKQLAELSKNKVKSRDIAVEKYRITRQNQRKERLKKILENQSKLLCPLDDKELFIAGLFLYWGEGEKRPGILSVSNSNPKVIKFVLYWMVNSLKVSKDKIKISLHLYKDMNEHETVNYWSKFLDIPTTQFNKSYIKTTNRLGLTYKSFGYGTCRIYISSIELSEKIAMSIKTISDLYGAKDDIFWYN